MPISYKSGAAGPGSYLLFEVLTEVDAGKWAA
jgi:hypothetical protein